MPSGLLDTSVLYAAAYPRDRAHDEALPILRGVDDGSLPDAVVIEFVLAETLNGLTSSAGHAAAVDFLERLEENQRFDIRALTASQFATAKTVFRQHRGLSLVDSAIVAVARADEIEYCYAFDDDFDAAVGLTRLATATNPYDPT